MSRWLGLTLMLATAAVTAALTLYVWENRVDLLPDEVPVHWGPSGEPDGWVRREASYGSLMTVPLMMFGFIGLAVALPWLSPRKYEITPFAGTYWFVMAMLLVMFGYLQLAILAAQKGDLSPRELPRWMVGGMMLFMILIGNVLGKVRRNPWMGVKTPWTLASDQVWTKTHRLAAWLFVGGGVAGLALTLLGVNPLVAIAPFLVAAAYPMFYSWRLYRRLKREGKLDDVAGGAAPPAES